MNKYLRVTEEEIEHMSKICEKAKNGYALTFSIADIMLNLFENRIISKEEIMEDDEDLQGGYI